MKKLKEKINLEEHFIFIGITTICYLIAMIFVNSVVAPIQTIFAPEITPFAAFLFPGHGVRVLAAWLFGWLSIPYLLIATTITHLLLVNETSINWGLNLMVSSVAWFSFFLFRLGGVELPETTSKVKLPTWRVLLLVGFVSSIFSSVGHNLILAGAVLPENSMKIMVSYVIGDTSGTFLCFFVMMLFFRNFRRI